MNLSIEEYVEKIGYSQSLILTMLTNTGEYTRTDFREKKKIKNVEVFIHFFRNISLILESIISILERHVYPVIISELTIFQDLKNF